MAVFFDLTGYTGDDGDGAGFGMVQNLGFDPLDRTGDETLTPGEETLQYAMFSLLTDLEGEMKGVYPTGRIQRRMSGIPIRVTPTPSNG